MDAFRQKITDPSRQGQSVIYGLSPLSQATDNTCGPADHLPVRAHYLTGVQTVLLFVIFDTVG